METYKDLFDNAHDLIHLVHLDGTLLYANKAWMKLLGYSLEEIKGKSIYSFIAENNRKQYIAYRENIIKGRVQDEEILTAFKTKTGDEIVLEGFISVKVIDNQPLYTRGIFRDVTAKLQNEEKLQLYTNELREREVNLRNLLFHAPDAVIVIDKESSVTYWNPKAETVFGWSAEEATGRSLTELIIPLQHREAHNKGMRRYLATGEAHVLNKTIEITALNKEEREFYVSLTISSTQQKGQVAFIAFLRDISVEKKNALELHKTLEALKRSNQSLEEFAHAASHDLKEPIRKVNTFGDLLKSRLADRMDEAELRLFERMENATERMRLLIDDLLSFSQLTQQPLEKEAVDLNEKVRKALEDLELVIEEKGAKITIDKLPVVKGYRRQLQQLFQNLLSNSLKYSKPGVVPEITISARLVNEKDVPITIPANGQGGKFYLIEVKDNGIGFEQKDAKRIFNMFQRLHGKAEYAGTGIGLSIARKVVENHQGYIWAESNIGEGSLFFILLPVT